MKTRKNTESAYTLIDHTGLIHGPYACFQLARDHAEDSPAWEILNNDGNVVDWSVRL